ncbi:MAG TPA: thiolase family protein [Sphingopyxis sp.]|nr:thiolase family protein [Sphingopyxis sp.]
MSGQVAIVGVGQTTPSRADPRALSTMVADAVSQALADAGLTIADIDGFVTESSAMPTMLPAARLMAELCHPMPESPFVAYGFPYGTGLALAPQLASLALERGDAKYVLCWYGHHLSRDPLGPRASYAADPLKAELEMPAGWFGQPVYFAGIAQRYAAEYGLPDPALAAVAMEAREHAARSPGALKTKLLDLEAYRASPMIAEPLRGADCSLVSDGAIAFVMTSVERAKDLPQPVVRAAGWGVGTSTVVGDTWFTQNPDYLVTPAAISGAKAFSMAGMRPDEMNFAQLYDCFTINTILQFEDLGFAPRGQGAAFAIDKGRGLTDRLPVNTDGGLLAHSFMLGGGHIVEGVRQLRGQRGAGQVPGAERGIVTALGVPHHASLILERIHWL